MGVGPTVHDVETRFVSVPFDKPFMGSTYALSEKNCLFVRLHGDGVLGEAYAEVPGGISGGIDAARFTLDTLAPIVIGKPIGSLERLWEELVTAVRHRSATHNRAMRVALGLMDASLWDAVGKAWGLPAWQLWGGYGRTVKVMWIGGYYGSDIAADMDAANASGASAIKFKVGGSAPIDDAERLAEGRRLLDPTVSVTADANCGWSAREAAEFLHHIDTDVLEWFEEPSTRENCVREWRDLRSMFGISICAGQSEWSATQCLDMLAAGSIDVCNFDALWGGGPTEWRRVAGIAAALGATMAHHQQVAVGAHLLASVAGGRYAEIYAPERDPVWWRGVTNRPDIVDGGILLPDGGGFGWEYDWDWLSAHELDTGSGRFSTR